MPVSLLTTFTVCLVFEDLVYKLYHVTHKYSSFRNGIITIDYRLIKFNPKRVINPIKKIMSAV